MTGTMVADAWQTRTIQRFDAKLVAIGEMLKQRYWDREDYGLPFVRAIDRALMNAQQGLTVERYNVSYYRSPSATQPYAFHICNRHACDCAAFTNERWCWHRAACWIAHVDQEVRRFDCPAFEHDDEDQADQTPDCRLSYRIVIELAG